MSLARQAKAAAVYARGLPAVDARTMLHALLLLGICSLPLLLYLPFLHEPFLRDEGFYAAVAQRTLEGDIPYRDAFDNKPPLIFAWYALSFLLFGENVWAPRLLVALLLCGTTALVYVQGRLLFGRSAAYVAAGAFALSMGIAELQTNANTEYFLLLPMTGALVAFTMGRRTGSAGWYALSGFLGGLAIMTKQVAAFNFLLLAGLPLLWTVQEKGRAQLTVARTWLSALAQGAGCFAAVALVCAPFVATGTFGDLVDGAVFYAAGYSENLSYGTRLLALLRGAVFLAFVAGPWLALTALGVTQLAQRESGERRHLLPAWMAASALGIFVTGRFYDHYFVQLLPGMALLAAPAAAFLFDRGRRLTTRTAAWAWLAPLVLLALAFSAHIYLQPTPEARHETKFAGNGVGVWENDSEALGDWLAARTDEDDYIYNLGFQSELYFYADRRSPTRHLFDHPFAVDRKYEEEAIRDLEAHPPAYIVDTAVYEPDTVAANYYSQPIKDWIAAHYDRFGKLYYADIYRLKESYR